MPSQTVTSLGRDASPDGFGVFLQFWKSQYFLDINPWIEVISQVKPKISIYHEVGKNYLLAIRVVAIKRSNCCVTPVPMDDHWFPHWHGQKRCWSAISWHFPNVQSWIGVDAGLSPFFMVQVLLPRCSTSLVSVAVHFFVPRRPQCPSCSHWRAGAVVHQSPLKSPGSSGGSPVVTTGFDTKKLLNDLDDLGYPYI